MKADDAKDLRRLKHGRVPRLRLLPKGYPEVAKPIHTP
jgi:hypothetical protein